MGWLLVLGLKESLVEYATVCVQSEVILTKVGVNKSGQKKTGDVVYGWPLSCFTCKVISLRARPIEGWTSALLFQCACRKQALHLDWVQ